MQHQPLQKNLNQPVDELRAFLGTTVRFSKLEKRKTDGFRIVVIGDLHGNPYTPFLKDIISYKPDRIIYGGDIYDLGVFSNYPPEYGAQEEEFECEAKRITAYTEALLQNTKANIELMRGNHDDRVWRKMTSLVDARLRVFFTDPTQMLVNLHPERISIARTVVTSAQTFTDYMLPVGDVLLSHANFVGEKALQNLSNWSDNWHSVLGWPEFKLLVQFHTHQFNWRKIKGGLVSLVEPGMGGLPAIEAYKIGYQAKWKPGTLGALGFEMYKSGKSYEVDLRGLNFISPQDRQ